MKRRSVVTAIGLASLAMSVSASAWSQPAIETCSQAYAQCFDACTSRYPGGGEASAKCIDKCAMARAHCDRNGCFKDEGVNVCGLAKE